MRYLVAIAVTLTVGCAHAVRHEAPERVDAAMKLLATAAGHPVKVEVEPALQPTDESTAQFIEAYARAINRYDPSAKACSNCTAIYQVALDADALSLARVVQTIVIFHAPKIGRRTPARFVDGTLTLPLQAEYAVEDAGAPYGVDTVIEAELERMFAKRGPTDIADSELARYVLFQGMQLCSITPLTAVYARLKGPELDFARESLAAALSSPGCIGDARVRATWTPWFQVHAKELDDNELRAASANVFPLPGAPTATELPGLSPSKYALAVLKRAVTDPTSHEAHVLVCTDGARCMSPLIDYYVLEHTGARRRELAKYLVNQRSAELTTLACRALFTTRGAYQWRADFLEALTGDATVWTAAMTEAFRADAAAMNDQLVNIWTAHVPLHPALLRAATAAADKDPPRGDVIRDIQHLAEHMCRTDTSTDFFTVFTATVPATSPLAADVTRNGATCKSFQ